MSPLRNVAGKQFPTQANVKQAVTSWYRLLTLISFKHGYKPWWQEETNA
jgi:hypothetical protein